MDEGVEASPSQTHKSSLRLGFARCGSALLGYHRSGSFSRHTERYW